MITILPIFYEDGIASILYQDNSMKKYFIRVVAFKILAHKIWMAQCINFHWLKSRRIDKLFFLHSSFFHLVFLTMFWWGNILLLQIFCTFLLRFVFLSYQIFTKQGNQEGVLYFVNDHYISLALKVPTNIGL